MPQELRQASPLVTVLPDEVRQGILAQVSELKKGRHAGRRCGQACAMTREELEHIIPASGNVTDQYEFMIVGSQSILGSVPNPEGIFTMSTEADIYPLRAPELSDKIEGALGEGSQFHETYGYYAQGVGPETAILPSGWLERVHRVQNAATNGRLGYCLDVVDLFLSKAVAGRGSCPGGRHATTCPDYPSLAHFS